MKNKKSAFRQVFIEGKSSSRPQHLAFNEAWHKILWMTCPAAVLSAFAASLHYDGQMVIIWELVLVPPLFRFHEIWATMDNDEAHKVKGIRGIYWRMYSKMVKHRSRFSHSLLLGTPLRFCIAYWVPILAFVLLWNVDSLAITPKDIQFSEFTFPDFAGIFILYWYGAVALADVCHMTLDKFNPIQWFIGDP